jgi:hypothetical protein
MKMEGWVRGPPKFVQPKNISKRFLTLEGVGGAPPIYGVA